MEELQSSLRADLSRDVDTIMEAAHEEDPGLIGIRAATFSWSNAEADSGSMTPGGTHKRNFKLRIEDEVFFKKGQFNLIVGQTGSGKTSLLMALLGVFRHCFSNCTHTFSKFIIGEMHCKMLGPNSLVSLPRDGGIAFHAQESWVLNETIQVSSTSSLHFDFELKSLAASEQHLVWITL